MFTFIQSQNDEVKFPNVNSISDFCKAIIDPDIKATPENIFVSSAVMFKNYEELFKKKFPQPACQMFTFKLPSSILPGLHLAWSVAQLVERLSCKRRTQVQVPAAPILSVS
jgi:hypothetical protein